MRDDNGFACLFLNLKLFSLVVQMLERDPIQARTSIPERKHSSMFHLIMVYIPQCRFYFDFSPTYVGCGLICPHIVNCSVLLGAIISWGFLWPFIATKAGDWYPNNLGSNDFKGLYGYKVWQNFSVLFKYLLQSHEEISYLYEALKNINKTWVRCCRTCMEVWNCY